MDLKNLKIVPPEGMEWYQEGNEIKFRPIKNKLTYGDVAKKLFSDNITYYTNLYGEICSSSTGLADGKVGNPNNCTSEKQAQKLLAINKLMNVAKYLNRNWQPDWDNSKEAKYYLYFYGKHYIDIDCSYQYIYCLVYFKSIELAQQAIEILGEETIKLALLTDW